jgi:hypothetical protein
MDLTQKKFSIWLHAEKIHETLDLAILQGPLYVKIGVVELCTMPLLVTSQKNTCFAHFGH